MVNRGTKNFKIFAATVVRLKERLIYFYYFRGEEESVIARDKKESREDKRTASGRLAGTNGYNTSDRVILTFTVTFGTDIQTIDKESRTFRSEPVDTCMFHTIEQAYNKIRPCCIRVNDVLMISGIG